MSKIIYIFIGVSLLLLCGCENLGPEEPMEFELLDGPIDGLSTSEQKRFLAGDIAALAAIQGMARAILSTNLSGLATMIWVYPQCQLSAMAGTKFKTRPYQVLSLKPFLMVCPFPF